MQLLTEEIKNVLPALYTQEKVNDPFVYVKFFDPTGSWTWYTMWNDFRTYQTVSLDPQHKR